jgi:hypothetical protein
LVQQLNKEYEMTAPSVLGNSLYKSGELNSVLVKDLNVTFNGAGSTPATGANTRVFMVSLVAGTILGWYVVADQSGSCSIDVWKAAAGTGANYGVLATSAPVVGGTIAGTNLPGLTSAISAASGLILGGTTTLATAGWGSTVINVGDWLTFNLVSVTTCTIIKCGLLVQTGQ